MTTLNPTIQFVRILLLCMVFACLSCEMFVQREHNKPFTQVRTLAGLDKKIGEPFGAAVKGGDVYVSDGEKGIIWKVTNDGVMNVFAKGLDTPSQIAFDEKGDLFVADSGSHSIKKISPSGEVELFAGVENEIGYRDGDQKSSLFNAPIGIAVSGDRVFVADTYNDRIRVIENGGVSTLAGNSQGFLDDPIGTNARFDTPTGLAIWQNGKILVADSQNRRIRVVEPDGKVWTLAGDGAQVLRDGLLTEAQFVQPTAITVDKLGRIYIADGNAIRVIGRRIFPLIETISNNRHGFSDGNFRRARFNRPSGLAMDSSGNLFVADSANQLLRVFTGTGLGKAITTPKFNKAQVGASAFREVSKPRWTYEPSQKKREIAGTLGEIRGEIKDATSQAWFHNGLDIVGAYGETARFIRDEKVLRPIAVQNFDSTRELVRMPTLGYIHIRLGRDVKSVPFDDPRFQFSLNADDKPDGLRVPRGAKFKAGDAIGTLNTFNHVHLIAGRSGREMNALNALILPGAADAKDPTIEEVALYDEDWSEIETQKGNERIKIAGKTRIVVRAFDQMDGNAARRKLGLYKLGYQVFNGSEEPVTGYEKPIWTVKFDRLPETESIRFVYAKGSQSGATGETVFRYIVTNKISGARAREGFFDTRSLESGDYILRVFAADFFGNTASEDIRFIK